MHLHIEGTLEPGLRDRLAGHSWTRGGSSACTRSPSCASSATSRPSTRWRHFTAYVLENLLTVQEELSLTEAELITLQRNAIEASWAPPAVRQDFLDRLASVSRTV